jgi:hypothetical protein
MEPMNIFNWLLPRRSASIAEVAHRAASLVVESIRPQVEPRLATMGVHEARGYVRARAGFLVREAVEMVTAHDPPGRRHQATVVQTAALEEIVRLLYRRPETRQRTVRRAA